MPLAFAFESLPPQCSRGVARSALRTCYCILKPYFYEPPLLLLLRLVKDQAAARCADWVQSLSPRAPLSSHTLLRYW